MDTQIIPARSAVRDRETSRRRFHRGSAAAVIGTRTGLVRLQKPGQITPCDRRAHTALRPRALLRISTGRCTWPTASSRLPTASVLTVTKGQLQRHEMGRQEQGAAVPSRTSCRPGVAHPIAWRLRLKGLTGSTKSDTRCPPEEPRPAPEQPVDPAARSPPRNVGITELPTTGPPPVETHQARHLGPKFKGNITCCPRADGLAVVMLAQVASIESPTIDASRSRRSGQGTETRARSRGSRQRLRDDLASGNVGSRRRTRVTWVQTPPDNPYLHSCARCGRPRGSATQPASPSPRKTTTRSWINYVRRQPTTPSIAHPNTWPVLAT